MLALPRPQGLLFTVGREARQRLPTHPPGSAGNTWELNMARRCELTGKGVQSGNLVSHSNHKTRTRFLPNLCNVTLESETLKRSFRLRVAAAALRSVEHRGGLDAFLAKSKDDELSPNVLKLKREIAKKQAAPAA